jgi:hypothetical protein
MASGECSSSPYLSSSRMGMRHRYPETLRNPLIKRESHDAASWFQKRNQNQFQKVQLPRQSSEEVLLFKNKDENVNRAQTAPAKPKALESDVVRTAPKMTSSEPTPDLNSERPSTGRLVRQCLKCKVLYTVSHYCPLHSASSPTLLQPIPAPIRKKRSSPRSEAALQRTNPYTRFRTSTDPRVKY